MQGQTKIIWVGIRREDKSVWQRRVPLSPSDVKKIQDENDDIRFIVQPSAKRVFSDECYRRMGVIIDEDISKCSLIVGIKEVPIDKLYPQRTYICFSHTIKSQPCNMPTLQVILQRNIRLVDYEKITDVNNERLIAFGKYAGRAGTIDFLCGLGEYLIEMGLNNPFTIVSCSYKYDTNEDIQYVMKRVAAKIQYSGLPEKHLPIIIALTGNGRTAQGCKQVLNYLAVEWVHPDDLPKLVTDRHNPKHKTTLYATNILSQHCMQPLEEGATFDKASFKAKPSTYKCVFAKKYLPYITALIHCIYWDSRFQRYITNDDLQSLALQNNLRLLGISDVTCDLKGSIELLEHSTTPQDPFFYYNPITKTRVRGLLASVETEGNILYQAVDFLPCEMAQSASVEFSTILKTWIPTLARSDYTKPLPQQGLPQEIAKAVLTHQGKMAPGFQYIIANKSKL